MLVAIVLLSTLATIAFMILGLISSINDKKMHKRILRALGQDDMMVEEDARSLRERILRPFLHKFANRITQWAPTGQREQTITRLSAAGIAGQWEAMEWKGLQYSLSLLLALIFVGLFLLLHSGFTMCILMGIVGFLIGYLLPNSWLNVKAKQRQLGINTMLPDVLDLLTVSVEAGLGFDAALLKVVEKQKGVLAEEFLRVLQEIKMGRPRRDALRDLAKRNKPAEDLSNVVASLVQADQLGISIGGVLRNQAIQIRQKRRQRAEEKAQKAPVKMMIPLVFFVFPSIFVIILGPAVLQIIGNL